MLTERFVRGTGGPHAVSSEEESEVPRRAEQEPLKSARRAVVTHEPRPELRRREREDRSGYKVASHLGSSCKGRRPSERVRKVDGEERPLADVAADVEAVAQPQEARRKQ